MTRSLFCAGMVVLFCGFLGNAQIIYSNNFHAGSTSNIWGTAPTFATNFAGGSTTAIWNDALGTNDTGSLLANGNDTSTLGDSWLLPFNPQPGYVYTLTASLTFTSNPGSWVGFGFAQNDSLNVPVGYGRFADSGNGGPTGYDFMILTESSGNVQYFTGPTGNSTQIFAGTGFTAGAQTLTNQVILNTESNQWTMTAFVNGFQLGSATYASIPPIGAVGITQTSISVPSTVRWNSLSLVATGPGPSTNTINATVSFSPTNTGSPLNPAFDGMSYEKVEIANGFFTTNNLPLVKLFSLLGPAVLRIGGGTVDTTGWNGISNTTPLTASEVDTFAAFIKALPTNWSVIYGINLESNTPANCAAEATYAANALGSRLLGFEIGNEPEFGFANYSAFLARWRPLAAAITNAVPGWAVTNGGIGWVFADADAGQGQLSAYTDPFASDESGIVSLLTQHYYLAAGGSSNDTLQLLLQPDTSILLPLVTNIVGAATGHCPLGARITECGSYSEGGVAGVSDAYGAALWSLDFMATMAVHGGQGVNFHGGGKSPYSPLTDNGTSVTTVGPEFYGLKMFSLLPPGNIVPATVSLTSNINFTAYGVRLTDGSISALLNNKDTNNTAAVSINLGSNVVAAQLIELAGPTLNSTSGFMLGGATINTDGSWSGGVQQILTTTNGQLTVSVPPISAVLLNSMTAPKIALSVGSSQLTLNWPTNYTGWKLQSNSVGVATTNWALVPGSTNTNRAQVTIPPGKSNVFYRLSLP